jgi:hypothetical protein
VVAISNGMYNPHWIRCYFAGPNSVRYFWGLFYAPIWGSMISGTIAMAMIYRFVRVTESRTKKWTSLYEIYTQPSKAATGADLLVAQVDQTSNESNGKNEAVEERPDKKISQMQDQKSQKGATLANSQSHPTLIRRFSFRKEGKPRPKLPRTRLVFYQAMGYTASFVLVYFFPTTGRTIQTAGHEPPYAIKLLALMFVSSQGVFNWLVYFWLPRATEWRSNKNRDKNRDHDREQHMSGSRLQSTASNGVHASGASRQSGMSGEFDPRVDGLETSTPEADNDAKAATYDADTENPLSTFLDSAHEST